MKGGIAKNLWIYFKTTIMAKEKKKIKPRRDTEYWWRGIVILGRMTFEGLTKKVGLE